MGTFILTWNELNWRWPADEFQRAVDRTARGLRCPDQWSVGARRRGIVSGDRAFLLRQRDQRGIVASGFFTSAIFVAPHWDGSDRVTTYARLEWDVVLHPSQRLATNDLKVVVPRVPWDRLQGSGVEVPEDSSGVLEDLWAAHVADQEFTSNEELQPGSQSHEGTVTEVLVG